MGTSLLILWLGALTFIAFVNLVIGTINSIGDKKQMTDLTKLSAKVDAIAVVLPNIAADYDQLKAEIEKLKGEIDPDIQANIDALAAKLDVSLSALKGLDDSVVPPVVEPPVEPPVEEPTEPTDVQ